MENHKTRILDGLWFLGWAAASSLWCLTAAGQLGCTWDEPTYVARGLEHWRTGSYHGLLRLGTMPLPVDVQTLPLYLWERWRGAEFDTSADLHILLPWARAGTLVFWWLLLCYGRLAGRQLAGPWGGRLAVALLACEPSFLAHASLATTDIAISACLLALVYHFRTGRDSGWFHRLGLPAFWFAAAILAKASGLVFGPICLVVVEFERLWQLQRSQGAAPGEGSECVPSVGDEPPPTLTLPHKGGGNNSPSPWMGAPWAPGRGGGESILGTLRPTLRALCQSWRDFAIIGAAGLALTFVYCGSDWKPEPTFVTWAERLPEGRQRTAMVWVAEHLCIFSNAGVGLMRQVTHNVRGHGAYLLGQRHERALWYYFPVVLSIKLSVPLLLGPLLLALVRPRSLGNWAFLAAVVLLVLSVGYRVQIGIRFLLPLAALAGVGLAAAVVVTWRSLAPGWHRAALGSVVAGCVVWTTGQAMAVWPEGLCYVNELWGGTARGYRIVWEANYDWGQGLKELAHWQRRQGVSSLDVWYYGTDPAVKTLPVREVPLHALGVQTREDVLAKVRGQYFAVSTSLLHGPLTAVEPLQSALGFLKARQPVGRTTTFLIYDFTRERESQD